MYNNTVVALKWPDASSGSPYIRPDDLSKENDNE